MSDMRVVIVGAGFAGLTAGRKLAKAPVRLTVIDRRNFHLFQPLLYQVATAALNPSDIAFPIRTVFRGAESIDRVVMASVTAVDLDTQTVTLDDGEEIPYDRLLVATGATHSYFGNDDWAADAPGLKTVEDALLIRGRVLAAFEEAERYPEDASSLLTFVVVGAGPTGVELAGAIQEIALKVVAGEFSHIDVGQARTILVEGTDRVLPAYPPSLSASARRQLEELGVEVRTGTLVTQVSSDSVTFDSGETLEARTILWAAGVQGSPLGRMLGCEVDRAGRVMVEPDLSLPGRPEVFVAGDLAAIRNPDGSLVPGVAPAAIQQGRHVAGQITADIEGRPRTPFRYRDKGSLATIGRARAVADLPGLRFGGILAWLAWLAVHIYFLIGVRNRTFVFLSWAWSYLTFRRGARIITEVERRDRE